MRTQLESRSVRWTRAGLGTTSVSPSSNVAVSCWMCTRTGSCGASVYSAVGSGGILRTHSRGGTFAKSGITFFGTGALLSGAFLFPWGHPRGSGVCQMFILLHKPHLVKWSTKGGKGSNMSKKNVHMVYNSNHSISRCYCKVF